MATDPKYGRRDFFKDSVLSVAKAAKEYAAHVDAVPQKTGTSHADGLAAAAWRGRAKRCFSSGAPSAATA